MSVAVNACAADSTPGWTFGPVVSLSASPTSAAPSAPPSAPPSAGSGAGAPPAGATAIEISARNIKVDRTELSAPAGQPCAITLRNEEAVPHNVAIHTDASASGPVFVSEIFAGSDQRTYQVQALEPGRYFFRRDVHPTLMTGTLVVE